MHEELLDRAEAGLSLLRGALDGRDVSVDENSFHAAQAGALLARAVLLCEAALDTSRTERRPAAAVLLRPAIECWIDCCFVLYCKAPAVMQLTYEGLLQRRKIGKEWLGEAPIEEVETQLRELEGLVARGQEAGILAPDFKLRNRLAVSQRLDAAICCRGAALSYRNIYTYLYRGLSASEIHTSVSNDFHAEYTEDTAALKIIPTEVYPTEMLVAVTTSLVCAAGRDVFTELGLDITRLDRCAERLNTQLSAAAALLSERLAEDPGPEVIRALDLLRRGEHE